ncbi:MAG: FYDLN acid domain-containing protein [Magnetospirillum sp.]|nr:FYDLN acid domain-containing protein [Magnetospirillum sp.]
MELAARGTKRRCPSCGAAYYDLNHDPITCPKCQALFVETHKLPVRASRMRQDVPAPLPAEDEPVAFAEDEVLSGDDEDEDDETLIDEDGDEDRD